MISQGASKIKREYYVCSNLVFSTLVSAKVPPLYQTGDPQTQTD